jgi:hypothetical protein
MKSFFLCSLAWLYTLAWGAPATPRIPPGQNRISAIQVAELVEPPVRPSVPVDSKAAHALPEDRSAGLKTILEAARYGPEVYLHPPGPNPRVAFETWANQFTLDLVTHLDTGFTAFRWSSGKAEIDRFVWDAFRGHYIAYTLSVELLAERGKYRASFGDSKTADSGILPGSGKHILPTRLPVPQLVSDGETIALEFLHFFQALAARTMPWSLILNPKGARISGCWVISLRRRVVRSKADGRRTLRRHFGSGA